MIRKRYWKCQDCGETEKREPHRTLGDHMFYRHQKQWSDAEQKYVPITTQAVKLG